MRRFHIITVALGAAAVAAGCSKSDSVTVQGDVPVAYVVRSTETLGNPTDAIIFEPGGDLYIREQSSASAAEYNITNVCTQGQGDVSDPEVSYDGKKLLFSMRVPAGQRCNPTGDTTWNIWEYDIAANSLRRVIPLNVPNTAGDDVDPAYLPDGRIVFASNRQEKSIQTNGFKYLDEYERERTTALHVMNPDGTNIRQISYNQSHDRNPTVLQTGEIMYSRWDHVGERNQFSIFTTNPDGTGLFVLYGAHSPGNSFLHPREMPDGKLVSSLMPLSGTDEGGALMTIDVKNFSENSEPAGPGISGSGQSQATLQTINLGRGVSQYGRYSTPYPLWDGTNRMLVTWSPSQPIEVTDPITGLPEMEEDTPVYGVYMFDLGDKTLKPVVLAPAGKAVLDAVAIQARPVPNAIPDKVLDPSVTGAGMGILNVKSIYDTDSLQRMGNSVLVTGIGESIPTVGGVADLATLKNPALTDAAERPGRFIRISTAVPTRPGISMQAIGETEFEMQKILGYTEVEPDGSFRVKVPADTPIAITVVDSNGRAFTPHTSWIQVREGETRTCNGCHSPRRGAPINGPETAGGLPGVAGNHLNTLMAGQGFESMAETRTRLIPAVADLKTDMEYTDVWTDPALALRPADAPLTISYAALTTPAPVGGVIDFPTHVQPILDLHCVSCHGGPTPAGELNLTNTTAGSGRSLAYEELLVGDAVIDPVTGLPQLRVTEDEIEVVREEAQVIPGMSRSSHLIEVLFNQELKAGWALGATPHAGLLNASEKRVITEWADLGAQYFNSATDGTGTLRGVSGLDEGVFETAIHPILMGQCASCHQAFGGNGTASGPVNPGFQPNRFVLTGNVEGDFNVTASMVNNVVSPALSDLLRYPSSNGVSPAPAHPQLLSPAGPVLPAASADYNLIRDWIDAVN